MGAQSFICSPLRLHHFSHKNVIFRRRLCSRANIFASVATTSGSNKAPARIVCIGDIHSQWDESDEIALKNLKPDLALFVGDFGDEDLRVTARISKLAASVQFPIATVFGNHDAFFTASQGGRQRAPYDKSLTCRVTEQIELLSPYDVSYRTVAFEKLSLSVCGGRAFSTGGPYWKYKQFFRKFVGVHSLEDSTNKLTNAVNATTQQSVVFLAHNGPTGLGDLPNDPCGKDWGEQPGGDYGDEDLRLAIENARQLGLQVPLTVFGHMHKNLMHGKGYRTMVKSEPDGLSDEKTVMLNAAVFPRRRLSPTSNSTVHNFQVVEMGENGYVDSIHETWVEPSGKCVQKTAIFQIESNVTAMQAMSVGD